MHRLFELQPENITLHLTVQRGGAKLRVAHVLRPPASEDWLAHDRAFSIAIEDAPEGTRILSEPVAASCVLWDAIATSVAGYFEPGTVLAGEDWKKVIPPAHKHAAVAVLTDVGPAESPGGFYVLDATEEIVVLRARRETEFTRLVHRFKRPTQGQHMEIERLKSDSYIVHGRKNGRERVVYPPRLKRLCQFYDELILSIDGYSVDRIAATGRAAVESMDAQHKKVAILALFGSEVVTIDDGGEAADTGEASAVA